MAPRSVVVAVTERVRFIVLLSPFNDVCLPPGDAKIYYYAFKED